MKKKIILFVLFCAFATKPVFGQVNFKARYKKLNPIPYDSPLPLEEKVKIHQGFLDKATKNKDTEKRFYGFVFLFHNYLKAHDFAEASRYLIEAENIAKAAGNVGWQGCVSHQRGVLSIRLRNYEEAIPYYKTAAKLCGEAGDSLCLAESLEQISAMYGRLSNFKEAQRYFDMAMPLIEKHGNEEQESAMLNNFGILLSQQDRPKEGIPYFKRAIATYHKLEKHKEEAQALNNLADAYRCLQQYDLAIGYYQRCISINKEFNILENLITNYMGLYVLYDERGDFRTANEFLIMHYSLSDSIIGVKTQNEIADLEKKYEVQEKELALQKKQASLNEANRSIERGVVFLIFLLLLIAFGLWRWRLQTHRTISERAKNLENLNHLTQVVLEKNKLIAVMEAQLLARADHIDIPAAQDGFEGNLYNQRILTETDWAAFKTYFEKAYPAYLQRLRSAFPAISDAEERLFLFIKLNLTTKEAALILGISAESVKKTRQRLRKRLELEKNTDLDTYIRNF